MREIKKNGLVCKVAFFADKHIPSEIDGCKLFWKFVFMIFGIPLGFLAATVMYVFLFGVSFPFAARPTLLKEDSAESNAPFVRYERWPKIKGWRIWPIWPALFALMVYYKTTSLQVASGIINLTVFNSGFWFFVAGVAIFIFGFEVFLVIKKIPESEVSKLVKAFLKAKKEKVCPLLKIVD